MCGNMTNCLAWTFNEISPFSCEFFSKLESIVSKDFTVTGQMNCSDPSSAVMVDEGINSRDLSPVEENCILDGVKITGNKLGKRKRQVTST